MLAAAAAALGAIGPAQANNLADSLPVTKRLVVGMGPEPLCGRVGEFVDVDTCGVETAFGPNEPTGDPYEGTTLTAIAHLRTFGWCLAGDCRPGFSLI